MKHNKNAKYMQSFESRVLPMEYDIASLISFGRPEIFEKVAKMGWGAYSALTSFQIDSPLKL